MTISGYNSYEAVIRQLRALEEELEDARSEAHAQDIAAQVQLFEREAEVFETAEAERLAAASVAARKRRRAAK